MTLVDTKERLDRLHDAQVYPGHDRLYGIPKSLTHELRALDDRLEFVRAKAWADYLSPEYWYVRRHNTEAPDTYIRIETPIGRYRFPDHGVIHDLRQRDFQRIDINAERRRARDRREAERFKAKQERQDRMRERMDSLDRRSVAF